ncbi:unnamed protein product, partial [Closterium sp. Yama58-4]
GLMREMVLAAAFGVGPVMTAFSYASLIPTFCLSLLGGVNGPFHSAIASVLSKGAERDAGKDTEKGAERSGRNPAREQQELLVLVSVIVALVSVVAALLIFLCARPIIDLLAPGLSYPPAALASDPSAVASFALTRQVAISQLRHMAPSIALAPLIGIGFGTLSARGEFAIPSLSPSLSSLSVLVGIAFFFALCRWYPIASPQREIIATIASGMLQIATFTDLYFASFLPGTAAALGYANLLVMAPLGILSTALLVPLLPAFARLAHPKDRPLLKDSLRRGLVMAMAVTLPMTAVMLPLARPIVRIVFQRRSFDASATSLVSSLLSCYLLGSPCYLARDVLVRLFYSLADGTTPFLISTFAIAANAVLDFLFVSRWEFGPQGLVLATAAVNTASAVALLWLAHRRMGGLPLSLWWPSFSILFQSAAATAITVTATHKLLSTALTAASHSLSLRPTWVWLLDAAALGTTAAAGFLVFCALVVTMRLPEAMPLWARVKSLLQKYRLLKLRTSARS